LEVTEKKMFKLSNGCHFGLGAIQSGIRITDP